MIIRPAICQDFETVTAWLVSAGLPAADLTAAHMEYFLVAIIDDSPVGMIGLEQFEDTGLLRSLVVDPRTRSGGVGRQLVAALEANALSRGVAQMWLLTTDADGYFSRLGYATVDRDVAPDSIRQTKEFSKLCPGDAVLMRKVL